MAGGRGGQYRGQPGGAGGTGYDGMAGKTSSTYTFGAGGGGGAGGGTGGAGTQDGQAVISGGQGGTADHKDGSPGSSTQGLPGGGAGGGGGYNGNGYGSTDVGSISLTGGKGGAGSDNSGSVPSGGGGAGGYGAVINSPDGEPQTVTNNVTVTGGDGGGGGAALGVGNSGSGGDGGVGLLFTYANAVFQNLGKLFGGRGGAAGEGTGSSMPGSAGRGGAGLVGAGLTVVNAGSITGGMSGDNSVQADAIDFTGGTSTLTLSQNGRTGTLSDGIGVGGTLKVDSGTAVGTATTVLTSGIHDYTDPDAGTTTAGDLVKVGAGALTLSGVNAYTGSTEVNAGTLLIDGAVTATSGVAVASDAALAGAGVVGASVDLSGTLSASSSGGAASTVGVLTVGALTMEGGSTLREDFGGPSSADVVKTGGAVQVGGTLDLESGGRALTTAAGQSVTLIDNTSAATTSGRFTRFALDGAPSTAVTDDNTFQAYGRTYQIDYKASVDGGNNDVVLKDVTPTPIPSPTSSGGSAPAPTSTPVPTPVVVLPNPVPKPVPLIITGTHTTNDVAEQSVRPFAGVTISDANAGAIDGANILVQGGGGTLSGDGLIASGNQYVLRFIDAMTLSKEIDALAFTPNNPTPGAATTTTFDLTVVSSAGVATADTNTIVTDTADAVSLDSTAPYANGAFTLSGIATSAAGVRSVELSADIDGVTTDLGAATVDGSGRFVYQDAVGAHTQGFITALLTDNDGRTTSSQANFSLTGGLGPQGGQGRQDYYTVDGSASPIVTRSKGDGSQNTIVNAAIVVANGSGDAATAAQTLASLISSRLNSGSQLVTYNPTNDPNSAASQGFKGSLILNPDQNSPSASIPTPANSFNQLIIHDEGAPPVTNPVYNDVSHTVVTGFNPTGDDHSSLLFDSSAYNNSIAIVLNNTIDTFHGVIIFNPETASTLFLPNVTKTQLANNQQDFTFTK